MRKKYIAAILGLITAVVFSSAAAHADSQDAAAHNDQAIAYENDGKYEEAVMELKEALIINPDFYLAHYNLGHVYDKQNKYEEAASEFIKAIKIKPDYYQAHFNLGIEYATLNKTDLALQEFENVVSIKPDFAAGYKNMGVLYEHMGQLQNAKNAYQKAVELEPSESNKSLLKKIKEKLKAKGISSAVEPVKPKKSSKKTSIVQPVNTPAPVSEKQTPAIASVPLKQAQNAALKTGYSLLITVLLSVLACFLLFAVIIIIIVKVQGSSAASKASAPAKKRASDKKPYSKTTLAVDTMPKQELIAGKYELLSELGKGGMGVVYAAQDTRLDRKVAIKKMRDELKINIRNKKRFMEEAKKVAKLNNANIVSIHDIVEEGDDLYLVFEFVEGNTLDELLDKKGKIDQALAIKAGIGVCEALAYAHTKGIIHRDIKPSNIMLSNEGEIKVMDFGIAREMSDTLSRTTGEITSGTLAYMAPEQHLGRADEKSDIFALGATLYEMLTCATPFPGPDFVLQKREMAYRPLEELIPDINKKFAGIINKCLEADAAKRFASAAELKTALEGIR